MIDNRERSSFNFNNYCVFNSPSYEEAIKKHTAEISIASCIGQFHTKSDIHSVNLCS